MGTGGIAGAGTELVGRLGEMPGSALLGSALLILGLPKGLLGRGAGFAGGAEDAFLTTLKAVWHFGHRILSPVSGIRWSSTLYALLQLGHFTCIFLQPSLTSWALYILFVFY